MKKLLAINFLILFPLLLFSQDYIREAGKITNHEMTMTEYENDKDAEALVIYNLGNYHFVGDDNRGFLLYMERRTKIKILKQTGEKYATFEIPYYSGDSEWEDIYKIEGTTYNWDGTQLTRTELDPKNIFEEKINDKIRVKKIALSNVKPGSVIEFSYTIISPYFVNMREWKFQQKIPVIYSKLEYKAIPYYEYSYIVKGVTKFDEINSSVDNFETRFGQLVYKEMTWQFGMKDLPAFRDEEFISSEKDYMVSMNFQISKIHDPRGGSRNYISTWPELCEGFLKDSDFGGYIKNSEKEAKKILPTLGLEGKSQLEQAKAITHYVKSMYNWNHFYGIYASGKLSNFMKQKTGSVIDLNLFLTGLLKAAGLEAHPVLLSTRENGVVSKMHPFRHFFNYAIAEVTIDNNKHYLDATETLLDFDELPRRCIHVEGLVIKPKTEEWIITTQQKPAVTEKEYNLKISPEQSKIQVEAKYISSGYNAYTYRAAYLGKPDKLTEYIREETKMEIHDNITIVKDKGPTEPFAFTFSTESPIESTPDKLFISPFCNSGFNENPFKQTKRTLPVDLIYFRGEKYKSVIEIPKGYTVEYIPKDVKHDGRIFSFNYSTSEKDGKIKITADYNYKKNIYQAIEYHQLKATADAIIKHFTDMIVLKKE